MNWFESFWGKPKQPSAEGEKASINPKATFFTWAAEKIETSRKAQEAQKEFYSRYTPRLQQALRLAKKEAARLNCNFIGTEHILLGLINLGQGVAFNVLKKRGLDLENVRIEIEKKVGIGPGREIVGEIPFTPRTRKVLILAVREAKAHRHAYVGTEHILLGLLREGDGVAGRVLKKLNVDTEQTRKEILRELDPNFLPDDNGQNGQGKQ